MQIKIFHMKCCAAGLALKKGLNATQKWTIEAAFEKRLNSLHLQGLTF